MTIRPEIAWAVSHIPCFLYMLLASFWRQRGHEGERKCDGVQREAFPAAVEEWFLILAEGSKQVSIEGPGRISGQAGQWASMYNL